jgi:chromate transporter
MVNAKPDSDTPDAGAATASSAASAASTAGATSAAHRATVTRATSDAADVADASDRPDRAKAASHSSESPSASPSTSPAAALAAPHRAHTAIPSRREIFFAFLKIGVVAFGGALPWVRRVIVDEKQWLTESEFTEIITVCQAVPGPNVVNTAVFFGTRCHGVSGGLLALLGLIGLPLVILFALNHMYHLFAEMPQVKSAMNGMGIVATAYLVAMTFKMAKPFRHRRWAVALCFLAAVLSAYFHWPMAMVLLSCGCAGVALAKKGVL